MNEIAKTANLDCDGTKGRSDLNDSTNGGVFVYGAGEHNDIDEEIGRNDTFTLTNKGRKTNDVQRDKVSRSGIESALTNQSHDRKNTSNQENENGLGGKETKAVSCLRLFVLAVLVVSTTCTAIAVYFYIRNSELQSFESSYNSDADNVLYSIGSALFVTLGAIDSYVLHLVSEARYSNQTFPFVTISDVHVHLSKLGSIGRTIMMQQAYLVSSAQREEWENYTSYNNEWVYNAIQLQQNDINYNSYPIDSVLDISDRTDEQMIHDLRGPSTGPGPYLATWQGYPILRGTSYYNYDAFTYTCITHSNKELFGANPHVIVSEPNAIDSTNNLPIPPIHGDHDHEHGTFSFSYHKNHVHFTEDQDDHDDHDSRVYEPFSLISYPIIDFSDESAYGTKPVGILTTYFFWGDVLKDILPSKSEGLFCVFENICNNTFTYEISGPKITFIGMGNLHDPAYSHMILSRNLSDLQFDTQHGRAYTGLPLGNETCPYTIKIYPSAVTESTHKTSNPVIFTVCAILIFLFTSGVFLIYDLCVERRQQKVMNTAIQSSENVSLLESMVRERTRILEETNRRLAEANRRVTRASAAQLEHFACMSHEIRTPLNCVIGLSSLLLDTELNPMQEESMRMIVTSGDLLLTVVNDVLDYSKLESGNVELSITRSNLQDTLSAVVQSIEARARPKSLSIRTRFDPRIGEYAMLDCRRLQQILYNLLGNALKFSNVGGTVDLSVYLRDGNDLNKSSSKLGHTYTPQSDEVIRTSSVVVFENRDSNETSNVRRKSSKYTLQYNRTQNNTNELSAPVDYYICFVVKDCGKGIERKDFQKIFEPFRQASTETERVYGGTGLGLAVTAKLVTALGGTVAVDSSEGEWTEFTVNLPYRDIPFDVDHMTEKLMYTTILLVDNDPLNTLEVSNSFQQCGVTCVSYSSMDELMSVTKNSDFIKPQSTYICIVEETLYDDFSYKVLAGLTTSVLITFGSKYSVKESRAHYRSLTQVLPSVMLTSFANCLESQSSDNGEKSLNLRDAIHSSGVSFKSNQRQSGTFTMDDIRIMMAEDNKINQKVLLRILNRLGYKNVEIVNNGKEACDLEEKQTFDILLMDVQMPVMNGVEACKVIMNRTTDHAKPKIVFVTAHVSDAFEAECRNAGGADFLPKPFNITDIENCLLRNIPTIS